MCTLPQLAITVTMSGLNMNFEKNCSCVDGLTRALTWKIYAGIESELESCNI